MGKKVQKDAIEFAIQCLEDEFDQINAACSPSVSSCIEVLINCAKKSEKSIKDAKRFKRKYLESKNSITQYFQELKKVPSGERSWIKAEMIAHSIFKGSKRLKED